MSNTINILLLIIYILESLYLISLHQQDHYHFRIFKNEINIKSLIKLLLFFSLLIKNEILKIIIILMIILIYSVINHKKIEKLKIHKTKRIIRLLILEVIITIIVILCLGYNSTTFIILLNTILFINYISMIISSNMEKLINLKYYKQAKRKIEQYNPFIIGITGSCGKTSVKNYIYESIKGDLITYKSPLSYNTLNGLTITINNNLHFYDTYFILEMGLSYKNDIKKITKYYQPNVSIITEILPAHLQTMKKVENIIDEKMQIIKRMKKKGLIIINNDNQYIKDNINKYNKNKNQIIKIGINEDNDYRAINIKVLKDGLEFDILDTIENKTIHIKNNLIGRHNVYNVLITYALVKYLKVKKYDLNSLANYQNRLELKKIDNLIILNDSYNSNINGFLNALEVLMLYDIPKFIITPGIVESGKKTQEFIKIICEKIVKICDFCYVIDNKNTEFFRENFKQNNYQKYDIKKDFLSAFNEVKNKKGIVLIENDLPEFYLKK